MQGLSAGMEAVECRVDECRCSVGCCEFTQGSGQKNMNQPNWMECV